MSNVSKSFRLLTKNEWPCAIHSGRSPKMSEWANHSFFERIAHLLIFFCKKRAIHSENSWANSQPWALWDRSPADLPYTPVCRHYEIGAQLTCPVPEPDPPVWKLYDAVSKADGKVTNNSLAYINITITYTVASSTAEIQILFKCEIEKGRYLVDFSFWLIIRCVF